MMQRAAKASSRRPIHSCENRGDKGCRACRWFEVEIETWQVPGEATQATTAYRVTITGKSTVPGEFDRVTVQTTEDPYKVVEFLALGDAGDRYIPRISRQALQQVAEWDRWLAIALSRFNHPSSR